MIRLTLDDRYDRIPWDELDNIVFDVGNVLLSFQSQELLDRVLPDCPELHEELTWRIFKSPYWPMFDRGSLTIEEAITAMSARTPEIEPYVRRIMTQWNELTPVEEGIAVLKACKAKGKKVYALTNYYDDGFTYSCEKNDFFRLFDGCVVSGREHMIKPGRPIYDVLISRYGLDPARTLFIDDAPGNIETALDAGWQGICFNRPGKLRRFFGL